MGLSGRTAIVTGAASGIGRAIGERLLAEGMAVAFLDMDPAVVSVAAGLATQEHAAIGVATDVTSSTSVRAAFERAEAELGPPWLLVNSAGVLSYGATVDMPESDWDRVLDVDLKGVFLCSQAALRSMLPRGGGRIVNISSIAGRVARPTQIAYCAAKAGADHFTRCLAVEVAGQGVTVNSVAPGMTRSVMLERVVARGGSEKDLLALIPAGRFALPEDHAALVAWLASDEASHVTGQVIDVDGGQSLFAPIVRRSGPAPAPGGSQEPRQS
ncbi:MAG TPA: SDR family NAD(P)-dependent oxidoreductase [Thermoanaerobaculia bacterium]|nr:SDR family NAD(P)-dependent oxidoreductase [Thermoanaerobaculia bacterium]